jgi:glycosyltransferase involved in cell wall biosynthesis
MTGSPTVSVVMTVYNGQRYLAAAIDSILAQSLQGFELLIVDDASGDETPAILAAYAARDARIRVLRNDGNLGPYPSANRALEVARAPLIARMDADDISESDRLARQAAFMEAHPQCLLVGSGYTSIDGDGRTRFVRRNPMDFATAGWTVRLRMPMVHPSFCFRRLLPDGTPVRYSDEYPISSDYALAAWLGAEGEIASIGDPLVRYRMHAGNISSTRLDVQQSAARAISQHAVERHYPPALAEALNPLLDALYRRKPVDAASLRRAIAGMNALLAQDGGDRPPRWMRERGAGILAEACLGGVPKVRAVRLALQFALQAPRHLVPLAFRAARLRNLLPPAG